jgi:hypothetical protein
MSTSRFVTAGSTPLRRALLVLVMTAVTVALLMVAGTVQVRRSSANETRTERPAASGGMWRDAGAGGPHDLLTAESQRDNTVWRDAGAGGPVELYRTR